MVRLKVAGTDDGLRAHASCHVGDESVPGPGSPVGSEDVFIHIAGIE